jgi:hypothetical protein
LLLDLAQALQHRKSPPKTAAFDEALNAFSGEAETLRSDEGMRNLPGRAFGQVFALGFAFEQFRQDLGDLLERTQELEGARPSG